MNKCTVVVGLLCIALGVHAATAPEQINYQAKVESRGVPFDGVGKFKFAIVDHAGTNTYWSNDGTSAGGGEPTNAVSLNVSGGLLNAMLGYAGIPNMTPIPASTFAHPDAQIRVWFGGKDGTTFERLSPDRTLGSVPYAMMAETVPDGAITGEKLGKESVWPEHEGRSDCVVTYYAEWTDDSLKVVHTNAPDKNFVITDVVFGNVDIEQSHYCAYCEIRYTMGSVDTVLFKQKADSLVATSGATRNTPAVVSFKSGLVVPAGAVLKIGGFHNAGGQSQSCTVSGFEIPVE
jgi:hypothetical protein